MIYLPKATSLAGSILHRGEANYVDSLMAAVNIRHNLEEWQLFIDSSMVSLQAMLLHNGNMLPSSPCCSCMRENVDGFIVQICKA